MKSDTMFVAGLDVGTECVKAIVMDHDHALVGRAVVPTRRYFQDRAEEALAAALDEAGVRRGDLSSIAATGFGASCVDGATTVIRESNCHARGAFHHFSHPMTLVDIGGRDPTVIEVDDRGRAVSNRAVRKCALGIGTFLMFAARHLDVHPTRLEELASSAREPAAIGSYCSVFANSEVLDRLREGASREDIALGCVHSIAARVFEIGGFRDPLVISGGVAEYFPGVMKALGELTGLSPRVVPEPIITGALGAALRVLELKTDPASTGVG